jgi:putative toxin-antitoxin system antitoxin component (TIGR02293 family)
MYFCRYIYDNCTVKEIEMEKKIHQGKIGSQKVVRSKEGRFKVVHKQRALEAYVQTLDARDRFNTSDKISYRKVFKDKLLVAKAVKAGVPYIVWEEVKNNSIFDDNDWASLLGVNVRTLQRYKNQKGFKFQTLQGEKIFEVAEVMSLGKEVFNDNSKFYSWLNTPSYALGSVKPIELLDTSYGIEIVKSELYAIEYGVFS